MKKLLRFIKDFVRITIPTLVLIALFFEFVVFRFILPATEWPTYIFDQESQILKSDPNGRIEGVHTKGKWATHPSKWTINNHGWVSDIDYETLKTKTRIAVIGDSFVEACQVNVGEGFAQQLHKTIQDSAEVYSLGVSGAPLASYLYMMEHARIKYDPDLFIINIFYNDFSTSVHQYAKASKQKTFWSFKKINDTTFQAIPPLGIAYQAKAAARGKVMLKKWIRQTATYRYFIFNFKVHVWWKKQKKRKPLADELEANIVIDKSPEHTQAIKEVTFHIIKEFKRRFPQQRIIFMMDAPRKHIYTNTLDKSKVIWRNQLVADACAANGFEFIDLTPHFTADYAQHQQKFGFPEDGHWNAYGHQFIATVLYKHLQNSPIESPK